MFESIAVSSLCKVFPDEKPRDVLSGQASFFRNEPWSFQVAYRWSGLAASEMSVIAETAPGMKARLYEVGLVPSGLPCYPDHDDNVVRTDPGLYPDPLFPRPDGLFPLVPGEWRSVWIEAEPDPLHPAGDHRIVVRMAGPDGEPLGRADAVVHVIGADLPEQSLIHTDWLHADCIATAYGLDIFSEKHWERIGQFIRSAVRHGINMLYTPLFTPPLDTAPGGERPTVQLVEISRSDGRYGFGFSRLDRWIDLGLSCGVRFFEFSHLFTQWGATHAPKIIASTERGEERIFGWETEASGTDYADFLSCFLPALTDHIRSRKLESRCYFHLSDEPSADHLASYAAAARIALPYLRGFPVIDALSDPAFYDCGLISIPVPATDHIRPFLDRQIEERWAYYCCGQYKGVSNRFFCMPSERTRILGLQLYRHGIAGFLHWGYSFWYSQHSVRAIDPFRVTDADLAFPSGDAFAVYPGEEGPVISLRLKVMASGWADHRALCLLESLAGRGEAIRFLEYGADSPVSFEFCPSGPFWLLGKRESINREIERLLSVK